MSFTTRIYRTLENELNRMLALCYEIVGPKDAPTVLIRVCIRNEGEIRLRNIRGTVLPLSSARFEPTDFHVPDLGPGEEVKVIKIRVLARANLNDPAMLERVATIDVTCQADLSSFSFHGARALTYSPRPASGRRVFEPRHKRATNELRPVAFHDRAIPLSK